MHEIIIEPLAKHHDRADFSCGDDALDKYFRTQASQDIRRNTTRVFVAVVEGKVVGYYTLSAASILRDGLPESQKKKLPRYPLPAVLLGRLAIDTRYQGAGLGTSLLVDAARRVFRTSEEIGIFALLVDAKNERAASFYKKLRFFELLDTPSRLCLLMETIASIFHDE